MGIIDKFKKMKVTIMLEQIISEEYEQKYFNECKFIWKNYIPKSGQSKVLQGELLRQIEKLRCEAQGNGNINWDDDFSFFCYFLKETLCNQSYYSREEKAKISLVMDYIKECGSYAKQYQSGQIDDNEFDINKIAYVNDNIYNIIADAIGLFQSKHPEPIPYKINEKIKR